MKRLIASRITFVMDDEGFREGVIVYKVNDGGIISREKAISVKKTDLGNPKFVEVMEKITKHAKLQEGINE
jgi:hypothetical protein